PEEPISLASLRPAGGWREVRFTPLFLLGALVLHAVVLIILWKTVLPQRSEEHYNVTMLGFERAPPDNGVQLEKLDEPPPSYTLDAPPTPALDRIVEDTPRLTLMDNEQALEGPVTDDPGVVGPGTGDGAPGSGIVGLGSGSGGGGGGHSGGRRSGLSSSEVPLVVLGVGGSGFKEFVDDLRQRGLDLVFVVDATASMGKFIAQARATIDEIIADVSAVVPDLRLGVVAYRDRPSDAVTQSVALTDDRYRIHNFLADLDAVGGGDFEEAVEEGLRVAIEEQPWRPGARRVLVLVGDAPPHEKDEAKAVSLVRGFARDEHSVLSVLYTGARPGEQPTDRDRDAQRVLEHLAQVAEGLMSNLQAGEGDLVGLILDAAFGAKFHDDIRGLLARPRDDWRRRIVKDKVAHGERRWLGDNLAREPVQPAVVDGCIQLFDPALALRALANVKDESLPAPVRSVSLYLLKRKLATNVSIDVTLPLSSQAAPIASLQRAVTHYVNEAEESVVPPAPRAGQIGGAPPAPPPGPAPGAAPGGPSGVPPQPPPAAAPGALPPQPPPAPAPR
ncbi:MAG TPA: vWA domain-containing protein, partial [Planctomycetota bacterium]|nr:vWA domain-containing protein [Planctomycetota bacterium]